MSTFVLKPAFAFAVIALFGGLATSGAAIADTRAEPPQNISAFDIVTHTPYWVWGLLVLLLWLGLRRTRERDAGLPGLVILPLVLVSLSAFSLFGGGITAAALAGLGLGALLGIAAGIALERRAPATPLGNGRLRLPGEWTSLAIILAVFLVRYGKGVAGAIAPALLQNEVFALSTAALSAMVSALLLTRTVLRLGLALAAGPARAA